MHRVEWMVADHALNLAVDEALLHSAEAGESGEVLRLWEFHSPVVVIGRGSRVAVEVDLDACRARRVPILRRASGGAAIVAGPGCLMYSVVLSLHRRPEMRRLDAVHQFVMGTLSQQIGAVLDGVAARGTCDLTWQNRKFSGNSLRVARDHVLYHGTLLYAADLDLISSCLKTPPRRPAYREDRDHATFVTNVPLTAIQLRQAASDAFAADQRLPQTSDPVAAGLWERAARLAAERYGCDAWTYRH